MSLFERLLEVKEYQFENEDKVARVIADYASKIGRGFTFDRSDYNEKYYEAYHYHHDLDEVKEHGGKYAVDISLYKNVEEFANYNYGTIVCVMSNDAMVVVMTVKIHDDEYNYYEYRVYNNSPISDTLRKRVEHRRLFDQKDLFDYIKGDYNITFKSFLRGKYTR